MAKVVNGRKAAVRNLVNVEGELGLDVRMFPFAKGNDRSIFRFQPGKLHRHRPIGGLGVANIVADVMGERQHWPLPGRRWAVRVEGPKLERSSGPCRYLGEGNIPHIQTEFGFDINEIAHRRFCARPLPSPCTRCPSEQVGNSFLRDLMVSARTSPKPDHSTKRRGLPLRHTAAFIPRIAYAVTLLHRDAAVRTPPVPDLQKLPQRWRGYLPKIIGTSTVRRPASEPIHSAASFYVLPKIGPLKMLAIKGPPASTEAEYVRSVNQSTDALSSALGPVRQAAVGEAGQP